MTGRVLFLAPEPPTLGYGGGGLRSASLLEYLRGRYQVDVATFDLRRHSKSLGAKLWRNGVRLMRNAPPLFDRFSGYESQIAAQMKHPRYAAAVVEHFWCASYAPLLRERADRLVLDLHNIESELARTHAEAAAWPQSWASERFSRAYEELEREWLPQFDTLLVASEEDRRRVEQDNVHDDVHVYPNALPVIAKPSVKESFRPCVMFTGNLEYHPNVEAIRWFRSRIWPRIREQAPELEWRIAGVNPGAIESLVRGDSRIKLMGPVDNAVDTLAQAMVAVVPLLSGSGTRFKILEAWAAARAVISTSIGAEGLGAVDGRHLRIADDEQTFTEVLLRLLRDPEMRSSLGAAGRALYVERFTWPVAWRALEGVL